MIINPIQLGVIRGLFLALSHSFWAALAAVGWATPLIDCVYWAQSITPAWRVEPFTWERAGGSIGFTFLDGFVMGAREGGYRIGSSLLIEL